MVWQPFIIIINENKLLSESPCRFAVYVSQQPAGQGWQIMIHTTMQNMTHEDVSGA